MTIPVIFSIGSQLGPGGFASLSAGIQMLGQIASKVKEVIKDFDKFAQVHKHLVGPIGEADAATKALIDTMAMMIGRNKLYAAGVRATSKEFRDLSVAAAKHAQMMGTDATVEFNKLIGAIAKGRISTLKEYGIDIRNLTKLTDVQNAAMAALTEQFGDQAVEIQNTTEALFALDNNWDTLNKLLYKEIFSTMVNTSGVLGEVNDRLGKTNSLLENNAFAFQTWMISIMEATVEVVNFGGALDPLLITLGLAQEKIAYLGKGIRTLQEGKVLDPFTGKQFAQAPLPYIPETAPTRPKRKKRGGRPSPTETPLGEAYAPEYQEDMGAEMGYAAAAAEEEISAKAAFEMQLAEDRFNQKNEMAAWEEERKNQELNNEINRIQTLTGARIDADEQAILGQKALAAATNLAGDAATAGIQALIEGGKGFKAAVWGMISQRLAGFASEETILAARDFAAAASAAASVVGLPLVPGLMGSGGMHLAVAAAAGAGAVGAGVRAKSLKPKDTPSKPSLGSGGMVYGGGPSGGPAKLNGGGGGVTYNIVLKGDVADVFDIIADENETRRRSGQRGFDERTG